MREQPALDIDRRTFIASLGGTAAVAAMSSEAKADALEDAQNKALNQATAAKKFPTMAQVNAEVTEKPFRRGVGNLFIGSKGANVAQLERLPEKPTFIDFFRMRFQNVANHVLQSANHAMKTGMEEEVIFACLLHDTVHSLIKVDHGWWGAQMYAPYVSEKVAFAIRYHQALRFYDDEAHGYKYPDLYRRMFGEDYKPEPYIEATYKFARNHKWYEYPRLVTVNDLYAFEPGVNPKLEQFTDIVGRHFKQPKEGLGYDNSPSAHMWRSMAMPDHPL